MAAPRGISQPPTSFIGSQCQGIHHAPLNTYNTDKPNKEKNCTSNTHNNILPNRNPEESSCVLKMLATTIHKSKTTPHHQSGATTRTPTPNHHLPHTVRSRSQRPGAGNIHQRGHPAGLLSQSPIVCLMIYPRRGESLLSAPEPTPTTGTGPSNESSRSPNSHGRGRA